MQPKHTSPSPHHVVLALAAALLAGSATAQGGTLVGLTRFNPFVVSQNTGTCAQAQCVPAGLPPPAAGFPFVGGTAYDSKTRGVWVSNGLQIAKVDPRNACQPQCPVLPMPNTSPNNPVTGLAYHEPSNTVYVTDQSNVIRWYTVGGGCQLSLVSRCIPPIGAGEILTGCATDDFNGRIFYCTASSTAGGGRVYVAPVTAPCAVVCSFPVTMCGTALMGPLQGLAFDACAGVLWVTDGRYTTGLTLSASGCVVTGSIQCCINGIEPYVGLDILPRDEVSAGPNCTAGACPICPTMVHTLGGEPYVGSTTFSLDLQNAPGGTTATLFLNFGPCGAPVFSPPLCAGIRVPFTPPPFTSSGPTGGTPGLCNGSRSVVIPIPPNPSLCSLQLCSQFIGFCPPLSFANSYASNSLSWAIVGS